jgi:hypothetical protein
MGKNICKFFIDDCFFAAAASDEQNILEVPGFSFDLNVE